MIFKIWCEISGGVTGHRADWLKSNGEVITFRDRGNAELVAQRLRDSRNGPFRRADFSYTVKELRS